MKKINISFDDQELQATLVDNSSTEALIEKLKKGDLSVKMNDYANMEKVGSLGFRLPTNDEPIRATAGDLILYQGDKLVLYYAKNNWSFTRLGKVDNINPKNLKKTVGKGTITVTISLLSN